MNTTTTRTAAIYRTIAGLLGWFALVLQLYLIIKVNREAGLPVMFTLTNFFSFFTILTNILVALAFTWPLISPRSRWARLFERPSLQSALALHIVVVGITYSILLRHIWDPQGLQLVADRILHDIIPVVYLLFWFVFVPKGTLQWKNLLFWLIYPLAFLIYSIVRGAATGWYPYPFLNVDEQGVQKVVITCLVMMAGFIGIGLVIIALDRIIGGARKAGVAS